MRPTRSTIAAAFLLSALWPAAAAAQDPHPRPRVVVRGVPEPAFAGVYQGGRNSGPEQTERLAKKVKIGKDGRLNVQNISGDVTVTGGSGDEASIEAVKRTRGSRSELDSVSIDIEERGGRVDVMALPMGRNSRARVDFTITVPSSVSVEVRSISGNLRVTNVQGAVRGETVSGDITMTGTPKLENAKSVSGNVSLTGVSTDGDLTVGSGSGNLTARGLKVRSLELVSISGDMTVSDVICDRLAARSVSGNVEFGGRIIKGGRYELNSHSGDVRLTLANPGGFELSASSFSGSIRSDLPLTIHSETDRRDRGRGRAADLSHSMEATYGDGSAAIIIRTFSGDIVLLEK